MKDINRPKVAEGLNDYLMLCEVVICIRFNKVLIGFV